MGLDKEVGETLGKDDSEKRNKEEIESAGVCSLKAILKR
jgi:hypothetical protein